MPSTIQHSCVVGEAGEGLRGRRGSTAPRNCAGGQSQDRDLGAGRLNIEAAMQAARRVCILLWVVCALQGVCAFRSNTRACNYGGISLRAVAISPNAPPLTQQGNDRGGGTSSLQVSSTNLLKNMVGAGVFSLNAKVSAVSHSPKTFLPAAALVAVMAAWATYNFYMVGETCKMTESTSYGQAWGRTVSKGSEWLIQAVVTIAPIVSCLANSIVLTDILGLVYRALGAPAWMYSSRNTVIMLLSSTILYPLCIQKDLSALKSVSAFGILGHLSAMGALGIRVADKSYAAGGIFYKGSPLERAALLSSAAGAKAAGFAAPVLSPPAVAPAKLFVLASLLSYCFVCHYNAPRYYFELQDKDTKPNQFFNMASLSYAGGAAIYIGTMWLGLNLFGPYSASFALNSFSINDPLGIVARVAFGSSVLASFPLIFLNARNWFTTLASTVAPRFAGTEQVTAVLLTLIALMTSAVSDIGVVGSIAGAVFGSSMMFIFPPIMYMRALLQDAQKRGEKVAVSKIVLNSVLLVCGGILGGFGTWNSVKVLLKR